MNRDILQEMQELPFYIDFRNGLSNMIAQIQTAISAGEWAYLIPYSLLVLVLLIVAVVAIATAILGFVIALRNTFPELNCWKKRKEFLVSDVPLRREKVWIMNPRTGEYESPNE